MMAQYLEIKAANPGSLLFYRMGFLRAVLRGCGDRKPRARDRADEARQAPGRRHPDVRRADRARRRLPAAPDRARPPGCGLRADRGSRRGEEARRKVRGSPRRRPHRHAGHHHRGQAARSRRGEPPPRDRPPEGVRRELGLWPRRGRHLDRPLLARRDRCRRPCGGDRAARAARDRGAGRDLR